MKLKNNNTKGLLQEDIYLLQAIIEAMTDGISIQDTNYNIIYQNRIARDIAGNGIGKKCYSVYEDKKKICMGCPVEKAFSDGNFHTSVRKVTMPSGETGYSENLAHPVRNEQGDIVACVEITRDITERKNMETELIDSKDKLKSTSIKLEETNTALKVLLEQREIDKKDFENRILKNIKLLIIPYIERLKLRRSWSEHLHYTSILESNLMDIISSLSMKLTNDIYSLTPKEVEICNLIKEGRQSKEISEIMKVSFETVNCHRQNIRKKLGLNNSKVNLRAFILSLSE